MRGSSSWLTRDYLCNPIQSRAELLNLCRDLLQILNTNSEAHQLMSVYFLAKISFSFSDVMKEIPDMTTRFFGNSNVIVLNSFVLKGFLSLEVLRRLRKLNEMPATLKTRVILIPLEELMEQHWSPKAVDMDVDLDTVGQVLADFNKEHSFDPILSHLIVFVKGNKSKITESRISSRVIQKSLINWGSRDSDAAKGRWTPVQKSSYHSGSFEWHNQKNVKFKHGLRLHQKIGGSGPVKGREQTVLDFGRKGQQKTRFWR